MLMQQPVVVEPAQLHEHGEVRDPHNMVADYNTSDLDVIPAEDVKYSTNDVIGKGAYGTVFKGQYAGTNVAVKKIRIRMLSAKKYVRQEVVLHKTLKHPNIVLFWEQHWQKIT